MVFEDSVSIEQKARRGHCQRAEYDRQAERIICTGDPWLVEGKNRVRGVRIVYLLQLDEVRVTQPRAMIELPEKSAKETGRKP